MNECRNGRQFCENDTGTGAQQNIATPGEVKRVSLRAFIVRLYSRKGEMGRWEFFWRASFLLFVLNMALFAVKIPFVLLIYNFNIIDSDMYVKWIFVLGELVAEVALFAYPFINISAKRLRDVGFCSKYLYEYVALLIIAFEFVQRLDLHYAMGIFLYGAYVVAMSIVSKNKKNPVAEN